MSEADLIERVASRAVELYAAKHPLPTQANIKQAAVLLCLSGSTVRRLMRAGELSFNRCGLIPIEEVDRVRAARI